MLLIVSHGAFGDSDKAHRIDVSLKPRTDLVARKKALQLYLQNSSAQNFDGSVVCSQFCGNLQYRNTSNTVPSPNAWRPSTSSCV